jgi:hypothetical protein
MIKFNYKVVESKSTPGQFFIKWSCTWDGKHNSKWYSKDEALGHPFAATFPYKDDLEYYNRLVERFKKHKKHSIYSFTPRRPSKKRAAKLAKSHPGCTEWLGFNDKMTRADIEKCNPDLTMSIGDYVAYNPATLGLCVTLSRLQDMDAYSGHTTTYNYFQNLLASLMLLWD